MTIPKYNVKVKLVGTDGNAFAIMGKVKRALRDAGATDEEVTQYLMTLSLAITIICYKLLASGFMSHEMS